MPGSILKVHVTKGDIVKCGQSLLILEAMKMENDIKAPADGKVIDVKVSQGDCVTLGQTLIEVA
jgi:pyruvate carboxylase subunit B